MKRQLQTSLRQQRGISLFTVLILLLLALTAVLGAFRVANLNEAMLGNTADYVRARAAAEAMVRDAETDILGRLPPYTLTQADGQLGWPCKPKATDATASDPAYLGCRLNNGTVAAVPRKGQDDSTYLNNQDLFDNNTSTYPYRCSAGYCQQTNPTVLANIETNLAALTPYAATYRQFTGGTLTANATGSNPILTGTGTNARAWYWIEAVMSPGQAKFPASASSAASAPEQSPLVRQRQSNGGYLVFRITAVAQGLKPGTQVVIHSVFVPNPAQSGIN